MDSREEEEEPLPVFYFKDELIKAITEHRVRASTHSVQASKHDYV
jgi:hypothetical protein